MRSMECAEFLMTMVTPVCDYGRNRVYRLNQCVEGNDSTTVGISRDRVIYRYIVCCRWWSVG